MNDQKMTKQQLLEAVAELRQRVAALEDVDAERKRIEKERRQAVEALQENELRLRILLETAPLGIYECDVHGLILSVNPSAERITGYSRDELIGTHVWDHLKLGPQKEALVAHLSNLATAQPLPTSYFLKATTKSGRSIEIQMDWSYRRNRDGQVIGFLVVIADVTARIEAESALLERDDWYRLLAETVPQPIWRCDASGVIECNRRWYEYTGQTPEEARGCGWMAAVHPDDLPRVTEALFQSAIDGTYQAEYRLRRASDDSYRWHLVRATPLRGKDGDILYWFGSATDIHDQKEFQEKLEQRVEERTTELAKANGNLDIFRKFAEDSEEGFGMSDFDGRIVYANPTLCRLFGEEKPEDFIGQDVSRYYPKEYVQRRKDELLPALLREGHLHIEQTVLPCHGKPIQTLQSTFLIRDESGNPFRIAVVISDITERKQAEEGLRQSHDELRAIYDGIVEGLLITDIETKRIRRVNSSFCRMLGYCEEELLTKSIRDLHPPEEVANDLRRFQAAAEGQVSINEDRPVLRKDGSIFYADITGHRILYEGRLCLLALFRDISERKQAQEALRESEQSLTERTALAEWRASQLQRLAVELTEAEERERRRLAQVLHDHLQQILVAAQLHVETTRELLQDGRLAAGKSLLERIQSLLSEAIGESRSLTVELCPPVLYERGLVAALEWLGLQTQEKFQVTISVEADPNADINGEAIGMFVFQAARELVLNAIKHGHATHVAISLSHMDENHVRLTVADDGMGCDPERLNPHSGPNGFGLFSIRERLDLIGGNLEITSLPGQGTKATIIAPFKVA